MNWLRKLLRVCGLVKLVVLEDHDGELNLRIVRKGLLSSQSADRMGMGISTVRLLPHGRVQGACYVQRWHVYPHKDCHCLVRVSGKAPKAKRYQAESMKVRAMRECLEKCGVGVSEETDTV